MKLKHPYFIAIFGPTAVGKTDLAIQLAQKFSAHIINMDVGQFYTPLTIGTAKPDWRSMPVPHHLFDVVDQPVNITVAHYREMVMSLMHELWGQGTLPILVGGSGFYLKSLFFPPAATHVVTSDEMHEESTQELWLKLYAIDPDRAEAIHNNDRYRIARALAIWQGTGKKPSEQKAEYCPPAPYTLLSLQRDRDDLYQRIDARVFEMLQAGWIDEAKKLRHSAWEPFLRTKKIIGYDDILSYLDWEPSDERWHNLVATIQQKTRNYAKRQMTFERGLVKTLHLALKKNEKNGILPSEIASLNLTLCDIDLYIMQLLKGLSEHFEVA